MRSIRIRLLSISPVFAVALAVSLAREGQKWV
jgi:hypothetical protein